MPAKRLITRPLMMLPVLPAPKVRPFALALVAKRLKTSWHLIRLATTGAPSRNAADVAATRYAITVSMVLDRLDDKRLALRIALKNNRVLVAKELLTDIYATEYALQVRIDLLESDWGKRLRHLMNQIAVLVEADSVPPRVRLPFARTIPGSSVRVL